MSKCPVDAHVHFHERERVIPTLEAAAANFRAAAGGARGFSGMLLLTQIVDEKIFEFLETQTAIGEWTFARAGAENVTVIARRGADAIPIVCGRQLRTAEGLEVLGLGTTTTFQDGLPLPEAVRVVQESGAVAVLPWAFGKWMGRRGHLIDAALDPRRTDQIFVGDNGGRLAVQGVPALVRKAVTRGFRVLRGTDPFPVAGDHQRVGTFGFHAETALAADAPWCSLRAWLTGSPTSPESFGRACGVFQFIVNQTAIRLRG